MLTHLSIAFHFRNESTIPDGLFGGSALLLQHLDLRNVSFPALQTFLLSATNLVNFSIRRISQTGYISPEAMVLHVATLQKLEILDIEFSDMPFLPDAILPPLTRTILPALRNFSYSGECKYLEDFISRIDTPKLNSVVIQYWDGAISINFDAPQLSEFINRSERFKLSLSRYCKIMVDHDDRIVSFCIGSTTSERWGPKPGLSLCLSKCVEDELLHFTNILGIRSPILSNVVHCTIDSYLSRIYTEPWVDPLGWDEFPWPRLLRQLLILSENSVCRQR